MFCLYACFQFFVFVFLLAAFALLPTEQPLIERAGQVQHEILQNIHILFLVMGSFWYSLNKLTTVVNTAEEVNSYPFGVLCN